MNLDNKIVTVISLSVNTYPPTSSATVTVSEEVVSGIFQTTGTYTIKFDYAYQSSSDPALLQAIQEKLATLP